MADAVLGGLILSSALSLLLVPAFYVTVDRLKQRAKRSSAPVEAPVPASPAG
jgi:Cu/Ag efflux pump CusA